ncbi:hypothetical protein QTA57_08225 [Fontisubflavum oceani]|uniref:hypothetical protein n=1 Tax=Fontisubflavum oceani TaxID=2978973 RepID=UPI0025B5F3B1|nr:hypothetical protein [Fontisubflavum oceani]WJY23048.1 hypothetical protein QTA57_08225 [Fontisubflavum oceani]
MANLPPVITIQQVSDALGENAGSFRSFRYLSAEPLPYRKIKRSEFKQRRMAFHVDAVCNWLRRAMAPGTFGKEQEAALYAAAKQND